MPGQILSPVPVAPPRKARMMAGPNDLFANLNASLSVNTTMATAPIRSIQERDWDVPAPPPPSPVSFHADHWTRSLRR
jgi:hypothetical protein